jgi:SAM-dependent methyltransferase
MRLEVIQDVKRSLCGGIQSYSTKDISHRIVERSVLLPQEPGRRRLARAVSQPLLRCLQPLVRKRVGLSLNVDCDLLCIEDRFGTDASLACLLGLTAKEAIERVLIPGCYVGGEDVQFWLRRGVKQLEGIDVYCLQERWDAIGPQLERHFGAQVRFSQASIEALPFPDQAFDLLSTSAVLEHVRNLGAMVDETARVLRAGGWAWHCFGPLYYSFGADHCISAYGAAAGYDHLLLDEEEYQQRIRNQAFFDKQADPNLPFWALNQQFSFATAADYLDLFPQRFHLEMVIAKVSAKGLAYRRYFPERWAQLLAAGVAECDLLIKSLAVVLRKK